MKTIQLHNDLEIPQIGIGTWTLRGEMKQINRKNH
jgi:diketogulonate reductase-like aldo/keto reductase